MNLITELQANAAVARRFEEDGYVVTLEPQRNEIPFDLDGYRPDILAVKPGDNVIVEVKRASSKKPSDVYLKVSKTAADHPGWSFKLVTLPQELDDLTVQSDVTPQDIRDLLAKVDI